MPRRPTPRAAARLARLAALAVTGALLAAARPVAAQPALPAPPALYAMCATGLTGTLTACAAVGVALDALPGGVGTEVSVWMRSLQGSASFAAAFPGAAPNAPSAALARTVVHFKPGTAVADEAGDAILNRGTLTSYTSQAATQNAGARPGAGWTFTADPDRPSLALNPFQQPFETVLEGCDANPFRGVADVLRTCEGGGAGWTDPRTFARYRFSTAQLLTRDDIASVGFLDFAGDPDATLGEFLPVGCDLTAGDPFAVFAEPGLCRLVGGQEWPVVLPSSTRPAAPPGTAGPPVPTFVFEGAQSGFVYDPPDTWGYAYDASGATLFTDVVLPTGFADPFDVWAGPGDGTLLGSFAGGQAVDFRQYLPAGVSRFRITGIRPLTDSTDPQAFPVQLFFADDDIDNGFAMTPLLAPAAPGTVVPEPAPLALAAAGLAALAGVARRRGREGGRAT